MTFYIKHYHCVWLLVPDFYHFKEQVIRYRLWVESQFFLEEMTLEMNFEVRFFDLLYFWLCRNEIFRLYQYVL